MRGNFDIIKYWIKELRRIVEFQEIAKVENHEFERLYGATDLSLANLFIETADETAIKRFEKICGIYPDASDTLEYRRSRIYSLWVEKQPYTQEELWNRLYTLCGDKFEINPYYKNYLIQIITRVGAYGLFDEITHILDYFLPVNLELDLQNILQEQTSSEMVFGMATETAFQYTITNDISGIYPLINNINLASPISQAAVKEITNDVNGAYPLTHSLYVSSPISGAISLDVTNDIAVSYDTESAIYLCSPEAVAFSEVITNDISAGIEVNEDKKVANVVTTTMIINT